MSMRSGMGHVRAKFNARPVRTRKSKGVVLRRFNSSRDSYEQLTEMLHTAFARLGAMGLNCTCVGQTEAVTRERATAGECFVAEVEGRVVATMTLYGRDSQSTCEHYRDTRVATLRQLAVDPEWQSIGIGQRLLRYAERWAAMHGYDELALDTPYPARHLVKFYRKQGFRFVRVMRFAGKVYDSAIMSKALVVARTLTAWTLNPGCANSSKMLAAI
jgi:GNAT superfamily N-acetyltransferase